MKKKPTLQLIRTMDDIQAGITALIASDPRLKPVHRIAGLPPLRDRKTGFEGLAWTIVSQQLSVASANAIWTRALSAIQPFAPPALLAMPDDSLRAAGLSAPKIRTLRALSLAVVEGAVDFAILETAASEDAHAMLTQVKGIGPWTADIYLLFCLGHADAFPAGDLALQEAVRLALDLPVRPSASDLIEIAAAWQPRRGIAARLLWAYYGAMKGRAGAPLPKEKILEAKLHVKS